MPSGTTPACLRCALLLARLGGIRGLPSTVVELAYAAKRNRRHSPHNLHYSTGAVHWPIDGMVQAARHVGKLSATVQSEPLVPGLVKCSATGPWPGLA